MKLLLVTLHNDNTMFVNKTIINLGSKVIDPLEVNSPASRKYWDHVTPPLSTQTLPWRQAFSHTDVGARSLNRPEQLLVLPQTDSVSQSCPSVSLQEV